jgi:spoIIIJ-associated protein
VTQEGSETVDLPFEELVRDFVEDMIDCLDWDIAVELGDEDEETLRIELSGEDRDVMMQNRAELLEVFQYLLNRIFGRELGEKRVLVDCDGYRARKELELKEIAARVSERVLLSGEEEKLDLMNPHERRVVHLAVAEKEGVTTESSGDGLMKRVIILPAQIDES